MSLDLAIVETGNGGDLQIVGNDLGVVFGLENQPYLAMFGGNKEAVTQSKPTEVESQDWWGNNLLMKDNPSIQMNSITERIMSSVALTSKGRGDIENAIKEDLKFLKAYAKIEVEVSIVDVDRIDVLIRIMQNNKSIKIIVIQFKKAIDGDFVILDFNDDFKV